MTGTGRIRPTIGDRIRDGIRDNNRLWGRDPVGIGNSSVALPSTGTGTLFTGEYLPLAGGSMHGRLAFQPRSVALRNSTIDITNLEDGTSHAKVVSGTGDLRWITGAKNDGQVLVLHVRVIMAMKHRSITSTDEHGVNYDGNIRTIKRSDAIIADTTADGVIWLVYEDLTQQWIQITPAQNQLGGAVDLTMLETNITLKEPVAAGSYDIGTGDAAWNRMFAREFNALTVYRIGTTADRRSVHQIYTTGNDVRLSTGGTEDDDGNIENSTVRTLNFSKLADFDNIDLDLIPARGGTIDIGTGSRGVRSAYLNFVSPQHIGFRELNATVVTDGSIYRNDDDLFVNSGGNTKNLTNMVVGPHVLPDANSAGIRTGIYDLGSDAARWRGVYAGDVYATAIKLREINASVGDDGTIYRNEDDVYIRAGGKSINLGDLGSNFEGDVIPSESLRYDLGSSTRIWNELYVKDAALRRLYVNEIASLTPPSRNGGIHMSSGHVMVRTGGGVINLSSAVTGPHLIPSANSAGIRTGLWDIGTPEARWRAVYGGRVDITTLTLQEASQTVATEGAVYRIGDDVMVNTGGGRVNLSSIGTGNVDFTDISSDVIASMSNRYDIGQSNNYWAEGYIRDVHALRFYVEPRPSTVGAPSENGAIWRNVDAFRNDDVFVRTRGAIKNMSDIFTPHSAPALSPSADMNLQRNLGAPSRRWYTSSIGKGTFGVVAFEDADRGWVTDSLLRGVSGFYRKNLTNDIICRTGNKEYNLSTILSGGGSSIDLLSLSSSIIPDLSGSRSLGSSTKRWNNMWSVLGNFSAGAIIGDGGAQDVLTIKAHTDARDIEPETDLKYSLGASNNRWLQVHSGVVRTSNISNPSGRLTIQGDVSLTRPTFIGGSFPSNASTPRGYVDIKVGSRTYHVPYYD